MAVEPREEEKPPPTTPRSVAIAGARSCEEIKEIARKCADQPLQISEPGAWAVLTGISTNARQRVQGMNIVLTGDDHSIGRLVDDYCFRINDIAVSGSHCRIFRGNAVVGQEDAVDSPVPVFLKDASTNGTFLNWTKLKKSSPEVRLRHGDIISFLGLPHDEKAYAFVFREVSDSLLSNGEFVKRKSDVLITPEVKRSKRISLGVSEGPVSLDDVRSLQRSNTALRKELESNVLTIENMRAEAQAFIIAHQNEIKELRESLSGSYIGQINELRQSLGAKQNELDETKTLLAQLQQSTKDLDERFAMLVQSRAEADEIIKSQKGIILEREAQLDEERRQRREEREKAAADLKSALQRAHLEAQEEYERQKDSHLQQLREQQQLIIKLQDAGRESQALVESLRAKLEETRNNLVSSEEKARQLKTLLQEEKQLNESNIKRFRTAHLEIKTLKEELGREKAAREEAWVKVSALELEIAAVIHELSAEKRRFQGARERLILRETQLRAFYSTTEEISALFCKQQEQLTAMQRALAEGDEEDGDDTPVAAAAAPVLRVQAMDSCAATDGTQDLECDGAVVAGETESTGEVWRCGDGGGGGGSGAAELVDTADLMASEGVGSWAEFTANSGHGESNAPTAASDAETEDGGDGDGDRDAGVDHQVIPDSM
ncbi:SMAD/FHA domain-containing protein isoform X2 [Wolffia australiana]